MLGIEIGLLQTSRDLNNMIKGKTIEIDTSKWERSANRFVGFIDIMGFKDMVLRNNEEVLYIIMRRIRESIFQNVLIHGTGDPEETKYESSIEIIMFSDCIVTFSKDQSAETLESFINAMSGLTNDLIRNHIPFKGVVAAGFMTLDFKNSIFFGQPLNDAYSLHDELGFYGVVVHGTADNFFRKSNNSHIFEYNCPFKNGTSKHLTVLPEFLETDLISNHSYVQYYNAIENLRANTSGYLRMYIDKTLLYYENFKSTCKKIVE